MSKTQESSPATYTGRCLCGDVRIEARGEPKRTGLCHCTDCQQFTGAPFFAFLVFPREAVSIEGDLGGYAPPGKGRRHFCRSCGSPVFNADDGGDEVELFVGTLDQRDRFHPGYEIWTVRRAPWLPELEGVSRHERDRFPRQRPPQ